MMDSFKILIVGGGFSGMAAAIRMAGHGMAVDLVEKDPTWGAHGAGLSISGATLRALKQLGLLEEVEKRGFCESGCAVCLADGTIVHEADTPSPEPGVPGAGAIMRPVLAGIMAEAVRTAGVNVRLGTSHADIDNRPDGVSVTFQGGDTKTYDLLVGADGLYSGLRKRFWPQAGEPTYTGQGVWRAVAPRPKGLDYTHLYRGHDCKAGLNPVSADEMYLFMVENRDEHGHEDGSAAVDKLAGLLKSEFSAPELDELRRNLSEQSQVGYRPLESFLLDRPWFNDRVVLIGDAVHATTPHLASGAGIGIEAGMVLADELAEHGNQAIEQAFVAYQDRRWERSRMVIENSARLGELEKTHGSEQAYAEVIGETFQALAQPI